MKKLILIVLLAILLFMASDIFPKEKNYSPIDSWLEQALACQTPEEAAQLLPKLEKLSREDKDLYLGIVHHNLASSGHQESIAKAVEYCRNGVKKKTSPLALGFYGSALTIQAGVDFSKNDMKAAMQNLQDGIRCLDESVGQTPQNLCLRTLRIENSFALTQNSPFNREDKIKEDLEFFRANYNELPPDMRAFFHLQNARFYLKRKNLHLAIQGFEKSIQSAPASLYARQAREELARLEK